MRLQTMSLQPDYVSTLPGKTKNSTKLADRLLQYILLNRSFQAFTESRSMFFYFAVVRKFFSSLLTKKSLDSH